MLFDIHCQIGHSIDKGVASSTQIRTCVLEKLVGYFKKDFLSIPQYIAFEWNKKGEGLRKFMETHLVATKNRSWLIIIPLKIYLERFPIQIKIKLFILSLLSLYKCRLSCKLCFLFVVFFFPQRGAWSQATLGRPPSEFTFLLHSFSIAQGRMGLRQLFRISEVVAYESFVYLQISFRAIFIFLD